MYGQQSGGAILGSVAGGAIGGGAAGGATVLGNSQARSLAFTGAAVGMAAFAGVVLVIVGLLLVRMSLQRNAR